MLIFDSAARLGRGIGVSTPNVTVLAVRARKLKPTPKLPMDPPKVADRDHAARIGDPKAPCMPDPTATSSPLPRRCQVCAAHHSCVIGQLPRDQQERLDPLIRELSFRKGDVLQTEGKAVTGVRTIKLGTVMLTRSGPDGTSRPVAMVGRGHLLDMLPLLGQQTRLGVRALSAGRTCELPARALNDILVSHDPALLGSLYGHLSQTLERLADWGYVMRLRGVPRQLVATLLLLAQEQGTRTVRLPSHIALSELLRTTRESVARTLRRLEEGGVLQRIDRWHVMLGPNPLVVFTESGMAQP
jgi:CRP/FNR family transcriptional regulator, cyclic AMP receptor protein